MNALPDNISLSEEEILFLFKKAEDRSRLYMLLSIFYMKRPREEFVKKLKTDEFIQNLKNALSEEENKITDGVKILELFIKSIRNLPDSEVAEKLAVDFTRLFRGIKKGYGPPPPYESTWRGEGKMAGEWTQEVLKKYREAGLGIDIEAELPDYIGVELKFMAILAYHEALAWRKNDILTALSFLEMEKKFIDEHLKNWVPEFCRIMAHEALSNFYKAMAIVTKEFLEVESTCLFDTLRRLATLIKGV